MKTLEEAMRLEYDDENANVTVSGIPVILMSKSTFGVLHKELLTVLGRSAEGVLYHAGYEAGRKGFKLVAQWWDFDTKNREEIISAYAQQFARFGWLNLETVEVNDQKNEITITVKNSFETRKYGGQADRPVCHYIRGFLCGFAEVAFNMESLRCDEVKCQGIGDEICKFVLKPMFW
jgi:predicted hydrocarbon binding protein